MIINTKPDNDKATYKFLELENKIKVILISDTEAMYSSASINVGVGSALDPKEFQGTAHFLEHMLFQGTNKYPKETEYFEFIARNGGVANA
jgi:secreted Zn-dependent insulinase-like peptidase